MQSGESNGTGEAGVSSEPGILAVEANGSAGGLAVYPDPFRLNIGAGKKRFQGWVSLDIDGNADINSDVRKIDLPDACLDEAMAIHVLEHIHRWEAPDALREWYRLLKPGGKLILELPDFAKCCKNVVRGLPENMGRQGIFGDRSLKNPLMMHAWGWTPEEVDEELRLAGFIKIRQAPTQHHGKRQDRDMRLEALKPL